MTLFDNLADDSEADDDVAMGDVATSTMGNAPPVSSFDNDDWDRPAFCSDDIPAGIELPTRTAFEPSSRASSFREEVMNPGEAARSNHGLLQAERSVVGLILRDNSHYALVSTLKPEDFKDPLCAAVYRVVQDVLEHRFDGINGIDPVTCAAFPEVGDLVTPVRLQAIVAEANAPSPDFLVEYAKLIKRHAQRRNLVRAVGELNGLVTRPNVSDSQIAKAVRTLGDHAQDGATTKIQSIGHFATVAMDSLRENAANGGGAPGISTGLDDLDALIGALAPDQMIVVAARPAMGKTSFAFSVARAAAKAGKHVLFWSLEMSGESLAKRMLAMEAGVDSSRIRNGALTREDWIALSEAQKTLDALPVELCEDPMLNLDKLRAVARRQARMGKLDLIIVDYLQLMEDPEGFRGNKVQAVTENSRGIKLLAKELGIPIMPLSQLNRSLEQRPDKRPVMSDLRESGAIEQDADVIMFIYRDEVYNPHSLDQGLAEIIIGKQRSGGTGTVVLKFDKATTCFKNHVVH